LPLLIAQNLIMTSTRFDRGWISARARIKKIG
jgi:hypothetical protein